MLFTASRLARDECQRVMQQFSGALSANLPLTVERFLAIQAMGSATARQDIKQLKQAVLSLPLPTAAVLASGLDILATADLRPQLCRLQMPIFFCGGRLGFISASGYHRAFASPIDKYRHYDYCQGVPFTVYFPSSRVFELVAASFVEKFHNVKLLNRILAFLCGINLPHLRP